MLSPSFSLVDTTVSYTGSSSVVVLVKGTDGRIGSGGRGGVSLGGSDGGRDPVLVLLLDLTWWSLSSWKSPSRHRWHNEGLSRT